MSGLRDARLKRALESAPDADARPDRRVRQAVLDAAREAVAPPPRAAWWKKLWQALGDRHMPWNAALATVVVATLVTVLWRDKEVPDARPDAAQPDAPASVTAPAAALSQPAPASVPPAAAPARKQAPVAKPRPQLMQPRSQEAEAQRERRAEVAVDALRDQAGRDLAKSAPAPEAGAAARAPAAAPAPAAPAMSRAGPPSLAAQAGPPVAADWTHLRIEAQGRSIELAREQVPRLAELAQTLTRMAPGQEPLEAPVTVRVEFRRGLEPAGVIELAGAQVRWTRAGRSDSVTARPQAALLEAAREEIGRLLPR